MVMQVLSIASLIGCCVLGGVACGAAVCYHTYFDSKVPGHNPPIPTADTTIYMGYAVIPAHIIAMVAFGTNS